MLLAIAVLAAVVVAGGGLAASRILAYDAAVSKVWNLPLADVKAPALDAPRFALEWALTHVTANDLAVAAAGESEGGAAASTAGFAKEVAVYQRGKHLAEFIGACNDCDGADFATARVIDMGPVGRIVPPNITMGGVLAAYSDAEFQRLLVSGVKRDGTTLRMMPAGDFRWWPDADVMALLAFLRVQPPSATPSGTTTVGLLGKILDQTDMLALTIAPRLAATPRQVASEPTPSTEYGKHLGGLCMGCHGATLSGGPIPGAPADLPIPANITPHQTGIAHYDFAKIEVLLRTGVKPDGTPLNPFMPVGALKNMSDVEMHALWAWLQTVEAKPFGTR